MSYYCKFTKTPSYCYLTNPFPLEAGVALDGAILAYEIGGPPGAPVVVVAGGISSGRHVCSNANDTSPGWWEILAGPGKPIDTNAFRILSIDFLGGAGASTSAHNSNRYPYYNNGAEFPIITTRDQARAIYELLDHLSIPRIFTFVGASFGGAVALSFGEQFPEKLERLIVISAPDASAPLATAWRSIQRRILQFGRETGFERRAVELARSLAMTTYRSGEEFTKRFPARAPGWTDNDCFFEIDDYLQSRGREFAGRFPIDAYYNLSLALDAHFVRPENITVPAVIVGADSDVLVPISQLRKLQSRLGGPSVIFEIKSIYGHDAFLKETNAVSAIVRKELAR
ncbi:MAG: homoserine O-succinyltransferase [Planctomycetota bacterium]